MTTDLLAAPVRQATRSGGGGRLVSTLTGHALAAFVRTPTASFFTLIFPVSFLVIVGATLGGRVTESGAKVTQYLVAPFSVFGVAEGAFCVLAVGLATLRENGVIKRLRGTPVPTWAVLASRILAAVVMSLLSVAILVGVGIAGYGFHVVWHKVPAAMLTLLVGTACCAALGLAVVALTRSVLATQALTNGVLIPLAFISNVFIPYASLPAGLDLASRALPLRHFADAMAGTLDPIAIGNGFALGDLAMLTAWAVAGCTVALWRFDGEPRGGARQATAASAVMGAREALAPAVVDTSTVRPVTLTPPGTARRPALRRLLADQVGYALTGMRRERLPVFFAVVFPALLLVLFPAVLPQQTVQGMSLADALLPGMVAYAAAVAGYVNLPEAIAHARAAGVLERLRGTPLPRSVYLVGRLVSCLLIGTAATAVLLAVAVAANGFHVDTARLPAVVLAIIVSGTCFGMLGLALLALMPSARTVNAVTLGTLMPLTFISDVFYVGAVLPGPLQAIGNVFPLKHAVHAFTAALGLGGTASGYAWADLAVVATWAVAALALVQWRGVGWPNR
jgi:ABC-type multidrug transport system permease subunit